jgi:septal ring factor EnvC (AmiA/AmiB activator)
MDIAIAISVASLVAAGCSIAAFFIARSHDAHKKGKSSGIVASDIEYIKRRVDDVLFEQRETNKILDAHGERITRVEEGVKQAHKRIDEVKVWLDK